MLRTKTVMGLLLIGVFAGLVMTSTGTVWAQTQSDVFWVAYYNGGSRSASQPSVDGTVSIINPGTSAGFLCADIYVFDPAQELKECCSCPVSIDGLLRIPLHSLTDNPANSVFSTTGAIKIVSDQFPNCDASNPAPTPELRNWIVNVNSSITETEFQPAPLSNQELFELGLLCSFIPNQSGPGVCRCS